MRSYGIVELDVFFDTNTLTRSSTYLGDGTETANQYDGNQLTETTESSQHRTLVTEMQNAYDENGNVTWSEDGDGNVTNTSYAGDQVQQNAVTSPLDGVDSDVSYQYDADGNVTWTKDGDGNITTDQFNGDQLTHATETSISNRIVSDVQSQYDEDGNVTWAKDGDNNVTIDSYQGDELLRETESSATGRIVSDVQNLYDELGNVTLSADGDANTLTPSSTYSGDGSITANTYDGGELIQGTKTSQTHPISDMQYGYDADGNVTLTINGDATSSDPNYDPDYTATTDTIDGDQVLTETVSGANGAVSDTSYVYDHDGNVTETTIGAGDPNVNGGAGDSTFSTYDSDQLMSTTEGYNSPVTAVTQYTYDAAGNTASETDPDNNTTNYTTDANGNTVTMITPLGTTSYLYDHDGNRISATDPLHRTITSQYDGDELTGEVWYNADGATQNTLSFSYDAAGNLLTASNNAGTDSFSYNGNELVSQTHTNGLTLTYGYDVDSNITSVTDSQGATEGWTYDGDEVSTQTYQDGTYQLSIRFSYDENGNLTSEKRYSDLAGTQLVGTTTFSDPGDEQGTIVQTDGTGNTLASYSYGWDLAGQLTSKTENGTLTSYSYDTLGQLTQAGSHNYGYDANGNPNGNGFTDGSDNEVSSDGTWNYYYSAAGDVTSQTDASAGLTWTYTYDDANQLTSATEKNSMGLTIASASYAYDAFGNRISTSDVQNGINTVTLSSYEAVAAPQVSTDLTYWHLWADLTNSYGGGGTGGLGGGGLGGPQPGSGNRVVQIRYIGGEKPDQWFARVEVQDGVHWLLTDYQGSIRQITDASGAVTDNVAYDPYGAITTETAPGVLGRQGWDGYQFDVITRFYHPAERDMDPKSQTWMQPDPLLLRAGPNPWQYGNGEPTNGTDPTGEWLVAHDGETCDTWLKRMTDAGVKAWANPISKPSDLTTFRTPWFIDVAPGQQAKMEKVAAAAGVDASELLTATNPSTAAISENSYEVYDGYSKLYPYQLSYKQNADITQSFQKHRDGAVALSNPGDLNSVAWARVKGFGEGVKDGAVILSNQMTFKMIPGLNAEATRLIDENGGAYVWSDVMGEIARESLIMAATAGAGSIASAASSAVSKVPGLLKVGKAISQGAGAVLKVLPKSVVKLAGAVADLSGTVACKFLAPLVGVLQPVQLAAQVLAVGQGIYKAWAYAQQGTTEGDAEAVRELARAGFGSIGLKEGFKNTAKLLKVLKEEGPIGLYKLLCACFDAGTPLETLTGSKLIDELRQGDILLSRDENDPDGPVVAKMVVDIFWRTGCILRLRLNGRDIGTTAEHEFHVEGKGWLQAGLLQPGDVLCSRTGQRLVVEEVQNTGEYKRVYNVEVEDFHTYFVGRPEWGWGAWAHNATCASDGLPKGAHEHHEFKDGVAVVPGQAQSTPATRVQAKVAEMKANMSEGEKGWTTFAAAEVTTKGGQSEMWVAAAGKKGYVPPRIRGDARVVQAPGRPEDQALPHINDAERAINRVLRREGATLEAMGATRPVCSHCQEVLPKNKIVTELAD